LDSFKAMLSSLSAFLAEAAASLPDPTPAQRDILTKLKDVQTRIEEGRLRVAVLGQFKRGKSTLLNALLGTPLLPTGIPLLPQYRPIFQRRTGRAFASNLTMRESPSVPKTSLIFQTFLRDMFQKQKIPRTEPKSGESR
jgi:ABC-type polysaccharide/polyol phosphate transport system ATPase subunit